MGKIEIVVTKDIFDEFDNVDDPDAVERAKTNPALRRALNWLHPRFLHPSTASGERVYRSEQLRQEDSASTTTQASQRSR